MNLSPLPLIEPLASGPASRTQLVNALVAYVRLLTAWGEAQAQMATHRNNPVGYDQFADLEIGNDVLQTMLFQGHVEHFEACQSDEARPWREKPSVTITADSAFALTELGLTFAGLFVTSLLLPQDEAEFLQTWSLLRMGRLTPRYDQEERVLRWGRYRVKAFRQPSENQELILVAAEELNWPAWIDDPLPGRRAGNPKVRLHDTIKNLNRRQEVNLINFRGDGTGTRVGWELK